ncbi:MAG: AraC family transcriptional regulator [Clostridia bacterium]|nr:AraC family transcriptional regulator [Clostridia bacterium]
MNDIVKVEKFELRQGEILNNFLEIIIPDGDLEIEYEKRRLSCATGSAIIIPPNCAYTVITCKSGLAVIMEKTVISAKKPVIVSGQISRGIAFTAEQAAYFLAAEGDGGAVLSAMGNLIAGYINFATDEKRLSPVTQRVLDDIQKNFADQTFSVEDCILKLPLNYDYVRKLFKKETGATPHEYLLSLRMERAQALLLGRMTNRYSNYSISQIAELCGFSEPLYFSRVFKKYFGASPSEYKK